MDPALKNPFGLDIDVLQLFRGYVFTLRELEDIFGAVNDLDGTILVDLADISREEPAIMEGFRSLFFVFEVT